MGTGPTVDLITVGRVSLDLFSRDIGAPFPEITAFTTQVGGSPTNIAISAARLGVCAAVLTAVGDDPVGDFVLNYLQNENVKTEFISRKKKRTGLAVLGVEPPDKFPLVFYRDDPADVHLGLDDVKNVVEPGLSALMISGTALSTSPGREAALYMMEQVREQGTVCFMDLDLRPDQWQHNLAYGVYIRAALRYVDVAIGTEEEFYAALFSDPEHIMKGEPLTAGGKQQIETYLEAYVDEAHTPSVFILKQSNQGARIIRKNKSPIQVSGFNVKVLNTVGAGDAFGGGLVYSRLQGNSWEQSVKFANACGAIVVTRHGCAEAMPYLAEVHAFLEGSR